MIKMVTDKKSGLEKPDFFNSKTILNLLYFSILRRVSCFRPYKYTNFKAIHNHFFIFTFTTIVVFDPTNIQILKQFTTENCSILYVFSLFSTLQYRSSLQSDRNVYFP